MSLKNRGGILRTSEALSAGISEIRSTRDVDFPGMDDAGIEKMKDIIADCCNVQLAEDGLEFESNDIEADEIRDIDLG